MYIKVQSRLGILSKVKFDESRIVDAYRLGELEAERSSNNHSQTSPVSPALVSHDTVFVYEIFFRADLRKALDENYLKLEFKIKNEQKKVSASMFSNVSKNAAAVTAAIFKGDIDSRVKITENRRAGIIYNRMIDLSSFINNSLKKNSSLLNDETLFGKIKDIKIIDVETVLQAGDNVLLSQRSLVKRRANINNIGFKRNYENALFHGKDSAELLAPEKDMTPASPSLRGTFVLTETDDNGELESIGINLKNTLASRSQFLPINTDSLPSGVGKIALTYDGTGRNRLIKVTAHVRSSKIGALSSLIVSVDAISPSSGIIGENLTFSIDHSQNVSDFYAPKILPEISGMVGAPPKNRLMLLIKANDPNIRSVDIYVRDIKETTDIISSGFKKLTTVYFLPNRRRKNEVISRSFNRRQEGKLSIFRCVPRSVNGRSYGNFTTFSLIDRNFLPYNAAILTETQGDKIHVSVKNIAPGVAGISLVRRDVTAKQRTFDKLDIDQSELGNTSLAHLARAIYPKSTNYGCLDTTVKKNRTYEYKCMLHHASGVNTLSSSSSHAKIIDPMNLVSTEVSNIEILSNAAIPSQSYGDINYSPVKISFNIISSIIEKDVDTLLSILRDVGLEDFFSEDISEIRDQFQNLLALEINRIDLDTGNVVSLGVLPASGKIIDDGIASNAPPPASGRMYQYRIMPLLISPQAVKEELSLASTDAVITFSSVISLKNPQLITRVRNNFRSKATLSLVDNEEYRRDIFITNKLKKSISSYSLGRGTLVPSVASLASQSSKSVLLDYPTGDSVKFSVDTGYGGVSVIPQMVTYGGHGGANIRWKISSSTAQGSPQNNIDYFAVIAKKQGVGSLVGCCHGITNTGSSFSYLDLQNTGFIGRITYSVIPVFLDGNLGEEVIVGSITQLESNAEKDRR